jgi:hypothetical protein
MIPDIGRGAGRSMMTKSGKLTGLLVEGGGAASLKVTLAWKSNKPPSDPRHMR